MTEETEKYAALDALFAPADYSHICRESTATVSITAAEMAAILGAYDRGIHTLTEAEAGALDAVIAKLMAAHFRPLYLIYLKAVTKSAGTTTTAQERPLTPALMALFWTSG